MSNVSLIINADDFGRDKQINNAESFLICNKLISSVSLMATSDDGFFDAIELIRELQIPSIGVHLCLSDVGIPLTDKIKNNSMFCNNNGCFYRDLKRIRITRSIREDIFNEFCEQVKKIKNEGIELCHLDSHQHIHMRLSILPIALRVCKLYNINNIRVFSTNKRSFSSFMKNLLRRIIIKAYGIRVTDYFSDLRECRQFKKFRHNSIVEIMCHPVYNSNNIIVDKIRVKERDECEPIDELIEKIPFEYELINFSKCQKKE